jgi:hypothetical protein
MSINNYILIAKKYTLPFINNSNLYIAALIGGLVGLGVGGALGAVSGGFIGYTLQFLGGCVILPWGIDPSMALGAIIGMGVGASIGSSIIGLLTIFKIYKNTKLFSTFSNETTPQKILLYSFGFSIELATGMGLGAIVGSLKDPGYGSIAGAFIGLFIMLLVSTFKNIIK